MVFPFNFKKVHRNPWYQDLVYSPVVLTSWKYTQLILKFSYFTGAFIGLTFAVKREVSCCVFVQHLPDSLEKSTLNFIEKIHCLFGSSIICWQVSTVSSTCDILRIYLVKKHLQQLPVLNYVRFSSMIRNKI